MADEQDEDALFDRLAKSLEAVRQDAELARSGGAEGISAGLARAEAELHGVAAGLETLRQRFEQHHAVIVRVEAAAAKSEADVQALRQTVETLSRRVKEQAEGLARASAGKPRSHAAALIVIVLLVLVLGGGAAGWIASGREPTIGALTHRFAVRLAELTGIDLAGPGKPTRSVETVAQATPNPEPAPQPQAAPAPTASAIQAPAALPQADAARPPEPPAAAATPPTGTSAAAATTPAETPTAAASQPAQTEAAIPLPPATPAAPPVGQSETSAPAATALAQSFPPPQAVRQLVLRATADAWVEVRRKGGRVLLNRIMKEGETWPVPAGPDLLLNSGNAGGLELEVDGVPTRFAKGGVVRDIPLDGDPLGSGVVRPAH